MKRLPMLFIFSLLSLMLMSCSQETTKVSNSGTNQNNYCTNYPYAQGCNGQTGGANGGGNTTCANPTVNDKTCPNYCSVHPTGTGCLSNGTNCNIYPMAYGCNTSGGTTPPNINPFPFYGSMYVDKNWMVQYPYVPSINCTEAQAPSGIDYTPYDTRKGSVTLAGKFDYDPSSGQAYFDTTSELLQSVAGAKNFFWGDSKLKIRFKANLQPESRKTTTVCPNRAEGYSTMKGYGRIKFDAYLVGTRGNGTTSTVNLGTKIVDINTCSAAIDLKQYAEEFPQGIYLKIKNVYGNQEWAPGTNAEQQVYDTYGFIYPQNSRVQNTWKRIRDAECWSLDIEVAADGTKTF